MTPPTLPRLRQWRPWELADVATALSDCGDAIDDEARGIVRTVDRLTESWTGRAGSAAYDEADGHSTTTRRLATAYFTAAAALHRASTDLVGYREVALAHADAAERDGFAVDDHGFVTPTAATSAAEARAAELTEAIRPVLDEIDFVDGRAARALRELADDLHAFALGWDAAVRPEPGISVGVSEIPSGPAELNAWWRTLDEPTKQTVFAADPSLGNRDGLPAADRDRFNRINLEILVQQTRDELAALDATPPERSPGGGIGMGTDDPHSHATADHEERRATLAARLHGYETLREQLGVAVESGEDGALVAGPQRYLLAVDERGLGAVAIGDPDRAENVVTYVPGTGESLGTVDRGLDRSEAMRRAADGDGPERTAVIAWYGYDTPGTIPAAGTDRYADGAAEPLASFQSGLRASHEGDVPSRNTVVGHSYGTTAVGSAAQNGHSLDADAVVFVASPGIDASSVYDLSLTGVDRHDNDEHVHATTARYDLISYSVGTVHGPSPTDPRFGATVFGSDDGTRGTLMSHTADAHSEYWREGNSALANMASIIRGDL